jgi:apolipoprotein N-acyltransferase
MPYFLFFSSLALSLASMPNPIFYLPLGILIGFVPLFILNQRYSGWRRFFINLLFSGLFAIALLIPLDAIKPGYVFLDIFWLVTVFLAIGFFYSLSFSVAAMFSDKYGWDLSPLFYGVSWLFFNYMLSNLSFVFTFPAEVALAPFPILIQSARIFGSYFIAFLIIFTNALIANVIVKKDKTTLITSLLTLLIVHSINISYGYISLHSAQNRDKLVGVAIIQSNTSSMDYAFSEKNKFYKGLLKNKLAELSIDALNNRPKLIIWPEFAGDYILQNDEYLECLHKDITSKGAELLIGTTYMDYCDNRKKFNIAFILKTDGDMTEPYRKNKIFPFSETQWLSRGNKYMPLPSSTALNNVGTMICLESICPQVARELTRSGAKVLVCISTDTSFGNSMVPYIHSASIVFRAVENNMYGIHVGNTGPSIICDNKGRIITQIPYGKTAYASAAIYPSKSFKTKEGEP